MQEYNLRPVWDRLLEIHEAIRVVCKKHGLRYWGAGGTILGAIRHKGFIPWDDDLDLIMPRPDYEKFWRVAIRDLPSCFKWKSVETDPAYTLSFGKVYNADTEVVEDVKAKSNLNLVQGLYVDVFPVDGQPNTAIGLLFYKVIRGIIRRMRLPLALYQKYLSILSYDKKHFIGVADSDSRKQHRCWWPKRWFDSTVELPFDKTTIPVPASYMEFIANHYRNWKELPPIEKRAPSHQSLKHDPYL